MEHTRLASFELQHEETFLVGRCTGDCLRAVRIHQHYIAKSNRLIVFFVRYVTNQRQPMLSCCTQCPHQEK